MNIPKEFNDSEKPSHQKFKYKTTNKKQGKSYARQLIEAEFRDSEQMMIEILKMREENRYLKKHCRASAQAQNKWTKNGIKSESPEYDLINKITAQKLKLDEIKYAYDQLKHENEVLTIQSNAYRNSVEPQLDDMKCDNELMRSSISNMEKEIKEKSVKEITLSERIRKFEFENQNLKNLLKSKKKFMELEQMVSNMSAMMVGKSDSQLTAVDRRIIKDLFGENGCMQNQTNLMNTQTLQSQVINQDKHILPLQKLEEYL